MPIQTPTLHSEILRFKAEFKDVSRVVVAYSGGLDSTVLLHLLATDFEFKPELQAIYIDHQLQIESSQWAEHCSAVCSALDVSFEAIKVDVKAKSRKGLESNARNARYQALHHQLNSGDILLTAHHQRDQAETFLLNLQRGSGVAGLAAMPYQKSVALAKCESATHVRPLLYVPYRELFDYAVKHQLNWVEDSSNLDVKFSRNQVRHQLLPAFEQACSNIQQQIQRSARHQSEALQLLTRLAEQDLQTGVYSKISIDLASYQQLDWSSLKNVIRYWAESQFNLKLGYEQLEWLKRYARDLPSPSARLKLSKGELRFYRTKLYYVIDNKSDYVIDIEDLSQSVKNDDSVRNEYQYSVVLPLDWYQENSANLTVRNIKYDDYGHSKRLKKWFQKMGIPIWERTGWPVLCLNNQPLTLWGAERIFENEVAVKFEVLMSKQVTNQEQACFYLTESEIVALSH